MTLTAASLCAHACGSQTAQGSIVLPLGLGLGAGELEQKSSKFVFLWGFFPQLIRTFVFVTLNSSQGSVHLLDYFAPANTCQSYPDCPAAGLSAPWNFMVHPELSTRSPH